jgi:hypothetical protein
LTSLRKSHSDSASYDQPYSYARFFAFNTTAPSALPSNISIDTRLSYRVGTARLRALPLVTVRQQYTPIWPTITPELAKILVDEKVRCYYYDMVRRARQDEDVSEVPRSILVVLGATEDGQYDAWRNSAMRIYCFLQQWNIDMVVQIIDVAATKSKSAVITERDESTTEAWARIQHEVLSVI